MHFTTLQFALFFLFVLVLNWSLRGRSGAYRFFILAANAFFYGCLGVRFLPLLLAVGLSNWFFALMIARIEGPGRRKALLALDVILNLGLLSFFKYYEFLFTGLESLALALGFKFNLPLLEVIFPIGISFFTFQGMSYAIDVYRDPERVVKSPVDILIFVSFFPTVLSGPIMRAGGFIGQLTRPHFDQKEFHAAYAMILSGLFKKVVIASYLSEHIVRQVFQVPADYSFVTVLIGIYAYSIQIFCDFSGYSDLAIGLALLLGFHIPENFRSPYRAVNLQEFWRLWHISLSTWLRDYLYIPLGGNRRGNKYVNLMITMVLGGLWHGAHARFLLWGALHGAGLVVTHLFQDVVRRLRKNGHGREPGPVILFIKWLATFNVISFLWVFFRAEDATRALEIFRSALDFSQTGAGFEFMVLPAILAGLGIQFFGGHIRDVFLGAQQRLPVPLQGVAVALICVIILRLGPDGVLPFIYFQF